MNGYRRIFLLVLPAFLAALSCGSPDAGSSEAESASEVQERFWAALSALCGQAFEGQVSASVPPDTVFSSQRLLMHVRQCADQELRIPFHVGDDRSRTWILTRGEWGLRLKHDHRHEDGSEDSITQYGGDTQGPGTARAQEFHADAFTAELLPANPSLTPCAAKARSAIFV
jgi:hypothetical protein